MAEDETGLHKSAASDFDDAPIPEGGDCNQSSDASVSDGPDCTAGQSDVAGSQMPSCDQQRSQQPVEPAAMPNLPETPSADVPKDCRRQTQLQELWLQAKSRLFSPGDGTSRRTQRVITMSVPALFVVLVVLFIQVLTIPSPESSNAADLQPAVTAVGFDDRIDWPVPEAYPENLRDPTKFGTSHQGPAGSGELIVKGIVYSSDNPSAVVGDTIAHEGDEVFGARVVKINKDSVEFEAEGKRFTQKVQP